MNNSNRFLMAVAVVLLAFGSCKKDKPTNPNTNNNNNNNSNPVSQAVGGSAAIPSDAAGALYAINEIVVDGGDTDAIGISFAWFGNAQSTNDAGVVKADDEELYRTMSGFGLPWYTNQLMDFDHNDVDWSVGGSSAVGAFDYSDKAAWPTCAFRLPAVVRMDQPLTISCTNMSKNDGVFFSIWGVSQHRVTKTMPANTTSVTFTAAELQSITTAGDGVAVQVMPIGYHAETFNGKKYYFVKQTAISQETETE